MKVVLIPAFNAVHTIAEVILKCKEVVDKVIVYDDGSTDDTAFVAMKCGALLIKGDRNRGKGFAMRKLFQKSILYSPEVVVTLDADMQHNPYDIPKLFQPILEDKADVVRGVRKSMSKTRTIGNKILDFCRKPLWARQMEDTQCGFRAYNLDAVKSIKITTNGFGVDSEILECIKDLRVEEVLIDTRYDKYSHKKNLISHFLEVFNFLFLRRPLLHLGLLGGTGFVIGLFGLVDVVNWWNIYKELAVGRLLFSMTILLLGALTFFIGLILHVIGEKS